MAEQGLQQGQRIAQEQILSPVQMQSLDLLAAPMMELSAKVEQAMAENPLLEPAEEAELKEVEPESDSDDAGDDGEIDEFLTPERGRRGEDGDGENLPSMDENRSDFEEELGHLLEDGGDSWIGMRESGDSEEEAASHDFAFDSITKEETLQEQLLEQLRFSDCSPDVRRAAEQIIGNIGDTGYFESVLPEVAQATPCSLKTAEDALALVQSFDPPGVGARDLKECLLLQLARKGLNAGPESEIIRNHLDDVGRNRLPRVAKEMGISIPELEGYLKNIRRLNPHPGATESPDAPRVIEPEAFVERMGDEFIVRPNRESAPRFLISSRYVAMLDDPLVPKETKAYIREKLSNGRQLQKALAMRERTIIRIAELIVNEQYEFMDKGPGHLRPMTMQQIAERAGIHETTVSRAIAGKYLATPWGIMPFKAFFTGGYQTAQGEDVSTASVKNLIRAALTSEDPAHPLSDSALAAMLKEKGLDVARRTVAKYREELGFLSSQGRKRYR